MKMNKFSNINTFMGMENPYDKSDIVVYGAGFDGTTSNRPGARFASSSMRPEFYGLETYSPILELDLEDFKICDMGDLDLSIGDTDKVLQEIYEGTKQIIQDNKIPFMIGGEHLVTLPAFKAVYEKYEDVYILHFDAHTDLREEYNNNKNSHATVIKRIWDIVDKLEYKKIYITIDLDVFDPSIFPGTGTPEPGGVTYREFENIFSILKNSNVDIVGCDIVELSPDYDNTKVSTVLACKVLRELALVLGYNNEKNKNKNK